MTDAAFFSNPADLPTAFGALQPVLDWQPVYPLVSAQEYLPFLYWLTSVTRPALALSLGVGDGDAHFTICEAVRAQGQAAKIFGIDRWVAADGSWLPAVPAALAQHAQDHLSDLSRLICANPRDAAEFFDLGNIDLLMVRCDLSADLIHDLAAVWVPLMSERGVIVLSGTNKAGGALDDICARWPSVHLTDGVGTVALLVGTYLPAEITGLAQDNADPSGVPPVLGVLRWFGHALAERRGRAEVAQALEQVQRRYDLAEQAKQALQEQVSHSQAERDWLHQALTTQEAQYRADLVARDTALAAMAEAAEERDRALVQTETRLDEAVQELVILTRHAESLRAQEAERAQDAARKIAELHQALTTQEAQYRADLVARDTALAAMAEAAEERDRALTQTETRLDEAVQELVILTRHAEAQDEKLGSLGQDHDALHKEAARRIAELKSRLATAVAQRDEAREKLAAKRLEASTRVIQLKATLEKALAQRDEARNKLASLTEAAKEQQQVFIELQTHTRDQQKSLQEEIAALRNSTSWRVTAPMRSIKSLVTPRGLPK